jgi:8-oxo-dGTP pyrophosphatase MutT (NUDIX family)
LAPDQTTTTTIIPVDRLELSLTPRVWEFASQRRAEIDVCFAALRRDNPALWNGQVLMLHEYTIAGGTFQGAYFATDFASMLAWRQWDFPDRQVRNCFAMGALRGSDGAFVLGVMAAHTANAGWIYFPAGVPDLSDVDGSRIDLGKNLAREMDEETGLAASAYEAEQGWTTVLAGARIAQIKILRSAETASSLRERILAHMRRQAQPELAGVRLVRSPAELEPMMPPYVTAFLRHVWERERSTGA